MLTQLPLVLYLSVVSLLGLYALNKTSALFSKIKKKRLKWLRRRSLETLAAESAPFEEGELEAKQLEKGVAAIENQFSVSQTITVPLISLMTLFALGIPFLPKVPAATLSALLAIFTLVLGVIGRPFLENAAAGVMLSSSKLIKIGDTVEVDGFYGTIEDISTTHTTIKVWDWRRVIKPNVQMLNNKVVNHSINAGFLWASVDFHLQPSCDLKAFEVELLERLQMCHHRVESTDLEMWVMALELYSARCRVAAWADGPTGAFYLKEEMNRVISELRVEWGVEPHLLNIEPSHTPSGRA